MKFFRFSLLPALLCGGASLAHGAPATKDFASGEILVKVSTSAASASVRRLATKSGGSTLRTYSGTGWQRIKLPANTSVTAGLALYQKQAGVVAVEPNYVLHALKVPNDPNYSKLYGMSKIGAPTAWDVNTGSQDIVVAVCDTGVKYNHPDLAANMWHNTGEIPNNGKDDDGNGLVDDYYGYDAVNADGDPMDDNGHGTHCAGVIGAVGDNKVGVVGVNWNTKIMALKFLNADGVSFSTGALDSYQYAIAMKKRGVNLRVISNSWGSLGKSLAVQSVMQEAADNGIISICAAGNDDTNNDAVYVSPSNGDVTGLVAVGATDEDDKRASFSNYGKKTVDLYAPGVNILSTWIGKGANAYNYESGTSMACPHVAGAAALLLAQAPGLSVEQVKARLLAAVDVLPQLKGLAVSNGRLNLAKLLSGGIYSLRGVTLNAAKKPVAGVEIFVNGAKTASAVSGIDGTYSVDGLAAGNYTARAVLKGYTFTATPAQTTLGGTQSYSGKMNFVGTSKVSLYSFTGTVYTETDGKKRPLEGVSIYLGDSTVPIAKTNASGKYAVKERAAGTYFVFAKYGGYDLRVVGQLTLDGSARVTLPTKNGAAPVVDFAATVTDDTPPVVVVRAPVSGATYATGKLTRAVGTAYDVSGVDYIDFALGRVEEGGVSYYLWNTKTWSAPETDDGFIIIPEAAFLNQDYNEKSVSWSVDLPEMTAGQYYFYNFPADNEGNYYGYDFPVSFTVADAGVETSYPTVTISAPTSAKPILPNTATTARGTAKDVDGVDDVYVYLRRFDEQGRVLSYYNWVEKTWVTSIEDDIYFTFDGKNKTSVDWSVRLPAMVPGSYELGALGRDSFGNEPPENRSEDTFSPFTVEGVGTGSQKASAIAPSAAAS